MYISILDYSRGTVSIINDTENVTKGRDNDEVYAILDALGFKESEIYFMISEEDPFTPQDEYVTLRELCEDVDEERLEEINLMLHLSAEDNGKEADNG